MSAPNAILRRCTDAQRNVMAAEDLLVDAVRDARTLLEDMHRLGEVVATAEQIAEPVKTLRELRAAGLIKTNGALVRLHYILLDLTEASTALIRARREWRRALCAARSAVH